MKLKIRTVAALVIFGLLSGCETTGSVSKNTDPAALGSTGLVLFTVTHDKDNEHLLRRAADVKVFVELHDLDRGTALPRAFSNMETPYPIMSTPFDKVWGRFFVRELPAGRYAFTSWSGVQNNGVMTSTATLKKPPPPQAFIVSAGSVTYLGNLHGHLVWRKGMSGIDLLGAVAVEIRNEEERDLALILKDYPQLQGRVTVAPLRPGYWIAD